MQDPPGTREEGQLRSFRDRIDRIVVFVAIIAFTEKAGRPDCSKSANSPTISLGEDFG